MVWEFRGQGEEGFCKCQKKPKPKEQRRREPEALGEQEVREGTRRGLSVVTFFLAFIRSVLEGLNLVLKNMRFGDDAVERCD